MKEEALLRAMGAIDGDLILEAKEEPMKQMNRIRRPLRAALIVAAVILLLGITAGAIYVTHTWDAIFQLRFQPTQSVQAQVDGNMDEPEVAVTRNGVTLSVRQTLCDAYTLYAVVEMRLPEDFNMSQLMVPNSENIPEETLRLFSSYDEASGQWYTGPATVTALWFAGEVPEEDLETKTLEELEFYPQSRGGSFLPKQVDVADRTVSYLLMMDSETSLRETPITIWFESISLDEETPVIEGPIYLTWTPSYSDDASELYPIEKDGRVVGALTISPLSLRIEVADCRDVLSDYQDTAQESYSSFEAAVAAAEEEALQQQDLVTIYFADGTTRTEFRTYPSTATAATGVTSFCWEASFWNELLDVESVTKVTVGELTILLE